MNVRGNESGFTRSDLLIVAALISLILIIQVPLQGNTKTGGQAAVCADNLRQLIQAWTMYADDNSGRLPPNNGYLNDYEEGQVWANGWLDFTTSLHNINTAFLVDFERNGRYGLLGPYINHDASIFKCPSDQSTVTVFGRVWPRVRSVSMNSWMGGEAWAGQTEFKVFRKLSDVTRPEPAKALVILDERADSINDSAFYVSMTNDLVDFPGAYHDGGANLSFADGHVGYRQWKDSRTVPPFQPGRLLELNVPMTNNSDLDFLRSVATAPR